MMFPGEEEAIRTVRALGAQYGYGNLIERLKESWRAILPGGKRCPADIDHNDTARLELRAAADELEADYVTRDTNDGSTYCRDCGAPQAAPWEHDGCAVALLRARAEALRSEGDAPKGGA